jgi:hypothetical protein
MTLTVSLPQKQSGFHRTRDGRGGDYRSQTEGKLVVLVKVRMV